ncbi:hypothetical protein ALC60_14700 [Trachymyrmex zeteki]|uniref:Uncharacterized protein n=1 Tax=Mycetomoellerius zeteki TaxID=64791 RepID=A0A151WEH9_9HYME|nr:hypothetical protein ALC60_14700 [Trachymyrmex zeteki]
MCDNGVEKKIEIEISVSRKNVRRVYFADRIAHEILSLDEILQQCSRNVPADARDSTRDFAGRDSVARYRSCWTNAPRSVGDRSDGDWTEVRVVRYRYFLSQREGNGTPPWNKEILSRRGSPRNGLDFYHVIERRRIPDMAKADDNHLHP